MSLLLYLVFGADILNRSSENEMYGFVYNIRVADVYRVFITFFSFHTLNSYLISFKKSLIVFLCYWTSSHLINNVTTYSTTGLKISLKVLKQFTEKDVPTRVDHSCWTWILPTCTLRLNIGFKLKETYLITLHKTCTS